MVLLHALEHGQVPLEPSQDGDVIADVRAAFSPPADRAFLGRVVRYLAADGGIRQFLDIGTGIPTAGNTHQVAQAIAPESRVVYVDYGPAVLAHARALLTSNEAGATEYIDADQVTTAHRDGR